MRKPSGNVFKVQCSRQVVESKVAPCSDVISDVTTCKLGDYIHYLRKLWVTLNILPSYSFPLTPTTFKLQLF